MNNSSTRRAVSPGRPNNQSKGRYDIVGPSFDGDYEDEYNQYGRDHDHYVGQNNRGMQVQKGHYCASCGRKY